MKMLEFDCGKLRELRKRHHWKQEDVGGKMCCTGPNISKWELGVSQVTAADLARLADVDGVKNMNVFFVKRIGDKKNGK